MSRTSPTPTPPDPPTPPSLEELRGEIDRIDSELVRLLNRRSDLSVRIGRIKRAEGLEIWSPSREAEVVARALAASPGPLPAETLRLIFRELMSASRSLQRPLRVAYLGPKYSYTHLASVALFGESVEHVPVATIASVFEETDRRHVQFGVVPLENSTDGRVADTLETFTRMPGLKIRAELWLTIHHCLLARCDLGRVRRVYSKAQALSQCRHWLAKNLPQAEAVDVDSTAAAAELAAGEEFAAAVASRAAGRGYGLDVLAANVEDRSNNVTRFAVIGEAAEGRTGRDITTVMLRLRNEPGALSSVILPFERAGINMSWIESFPVAEGRSDRNQSYLFFLDLEGHADDEPVRRALAAVVGSCERLDVLGSYPRGERVET